MGIISSLEMKKVIFIEVRQLCSESGSLSAMKLENEGRLSSSLDGVGGEWKEKGTSSKGLHSLQHREACSDCRSKWNSKKKKKKKEQQERAENFKDLWEEFSGFLSRKKLL